MQLELHLVVLVHAVFAAFLHVRQLDSYLSTVIRLFEDVGHVHLRRVVRDTQRGNVRQAVVVGRRWLEARWPLGSMSSGDAARGLVHRARGVELVRGWQQGDTLRIYEEHVIQLFHAVKREAIRGRRLLSGRPELVMMLLCHLV